jgi:hypothetical protein
MQKIGVGIVLLVIGMIIGLSMGIYISMYQTPSIEDPIKVTIQGIEYTVSVHSILKIDLLNNVPEKNLEGNIIVFQNQKQWTSEVTWHYTGYGETEVICDFINETENFRVVYMENSTKATAFYLDRIIEWNEVSINQGTISQAGPVLTLENLRFHTKSSTDYIEVILRNSGTADATVASVYVGTSDSNLALQSTVSYEPSSQIVVAGSTLNVTITYDWTDGTRYHFNIITEEGLTYPFQREA